FFIFFFQAEDGIRDRTVTGVQTCALPIWSCCASRLSCGPTTASDWTTSAAGDAGGATETSIGLRRKASASLRISAGIVAEKNSEIGRASCRERGEISVGGVVVKRIKVG